jgi:hypothetical protein
MDPVIIEVPYDPEGKVIQALRPYITAVIRGETDGKTTKYEVHGLKLPELVLELMRLQHKVERLSLGDYNNSYTDWLNKHGYIDNS